MKQWLSDWGWVLLIAALILAGVVLPALKWLGVIASWPWWAVLIPIYLLGSLIGYVLVGFNDLMKEGGR